MEAIKRELLKEIGYTGDFQFVCSNSKSGYDTVIQYNYDATNCHKVQDQKLDEFEDIEVATMSIDDFKKYLHTEDISDVATGLLGLHFLKLL